MFYAISALLIAALGILSRIDLRTFRLPDRLTIPLIIAGLLQAWLYQEDWQSGVIGALIGYGTFVTIETAYRLLRGRDGLGRGDAKLLAVGGAWCGWAGLPFIVLIASGSGLAALLLPSFRAQSEAGRIPFGPFLAFGIVIVWLAAYFSV